VWPAGREICPPLKGLPILLLVGGWGRIGGGGEEEREEEEGGGGRRGEGRNFLFLSIRNTLYPLIFPLYTLQTTDQQQLEYLIKVLPNYHHLTKSTT
jgi:hypothetical protein